MLLQILSVWEDWFLTLSLLWSNLQGNWVWNFHVADGFLLDFTCQVSSNKAYLLAHALPWPVKRSFATCNSAWKAEHFQCTHTDRDKSIEKSGMPQWCRQEAMAVGQRVPCIERSQVVCKKQSRIHLNGFTCAGVWDQIEESLECWKPRILQYLIPAKWSKINQKDRQADLESLHLLDLNFVT